MEIRSLQVTEAGELVTAVEPVTEAPDAGWVWLDVTAGSGDVAELVAVMERFEFDSLAVRDAVDDYDLPKVDDFGHHLLIILHGLRDDRVATYEVDLFMSARVLVTVHKRPSPSIDAVRSQIIANPSLVPSGVDALLARIADVLTRRLQAVLSVFADRSDELIDKALATDSGLLADLTAVRKDLAVLRRVLQPQREALDELRISTSPLVGELAVRRLSDAFDVASRATQELEGARTALAEILDAYRGAEARQATDVTTVLTVYAAIMLPLSLIAGFFGMNFPNLPMGSSRAGWLIVTIAMLLIAVVSLGVFVALGWIRRPTGRGAGATLGRGLIEASRAPVQLVGAIYEISTMPLRSTTRLVRRD